MLALSGLLAAVLSATFVSAFPTPNDHTNAQVLRQATRSEVIKRATRVSSAKRQMGSAVPILCGTGQQFVLGYSGSGTAQDGFYGVVGPQPDRVSSSYTMQASSETPGAATVFSLDSECNLVAEFLDIRIANAYNTDSSGKVYFDTNGNYGGDWPVLTCQVTTSTSELTCTSGSNVKSQFAVCPTVNTALYISRPSVPSNCAAVTIMATLVQN